MRSQRWYRIPIVNARKWLRDRWPPQWIAFYQPKVFALESFAINCFARADAVREALRSQLFPDEPNHPKASQRYFQLILGPLEKLPQPIPSRRWRRIVFIGTTWRKFARFKEINDLYDESPLEDLLWDQFTRLNLTPERQEFITANGKDYALDFENSTWKPTATSGTPIPNEFPKTIAATTTSKPAAGNSFALTVTTSAKK